jgi:hypothetical protein
MTPGLALAVALILSLLLLTSLLLGLWLAQGSPLR